MAAIDTPIPSIAPPVGTPFISRSNARAAIPNAEIVISTTWNRAAIASALPWPNR